MVGGLYHGPKCRHCGFQIHLSPAVSGGHSPLMSGPGRLKVQCPKCLKVDLFATSEVKPFMAGESWTAPTSPRLQPSGHSKMPLNEAYPDAQPLFGPGFLEDRPEAAAMVGRCLGAWSEVDSAVASLFFSLLGSHRSPAVAAFSAIRSNRIQTEAITTTAKASLNEQDYELVMAALRVKDRAEKERNDLAHGHFGGCYDMPRAVAWMNVDDRIAHQFKEFASPEASMAWQRERMFVYEPEDLATAYELILEAAMCVGQVSAYLAINDRPQARAQRYQSLSTRPHILEALNQIRGQQRPSPKPPKQRRAKRPDQRR